MRRGRIDYEMMGKRIQRSRRDKGMTQQELAEAVGVSMSYIGHIERGFKNGSLDAIAGICQALDVSADYLMFGKEFSEYELAVVCNYLERHLDHIRAQIEAQPTVDPE